MIRVVRKDKRRYGLPRIRTALNVRDEKGTMGSFVECQTPIISWWSRSLYENVKFEENRKDK